MGGRFGSIQARLVKRAHKWVCHVVSDELFDSSQVGRFLGRPGWYRHLFPPSHRRSSTPEILRFPTISDNKKARIHTSLWKGGGHRHICDGLHPLSTQRSTSYATRSASLSCSMMSAHSNMERVAGFRFPFFFGFTGSSTMNSAQEKHRLLGPGASSRHRP